MKTDQRRYVGKSWLRACIVSFVALSLAACGQEEPAPLSVGTNVWPGYEPAYIADEMGYFGDAKITLRQFSAATEVIRAFRSEVVDVAALTLDEALLLRENGVAFEVILVTDISDGADVIMADDEIMAMKDLVGRRVGVENSALGAFVLSRALELHGLDIDEISVVPMTVDRSVQWMTDDQVDAVVTFEPFRSELLANGAREIFSSREMPNEVVDVLVARKSTIEDNPAALRILIKGWLEAVEEIKARSETVMPIVARRLGLSESEAILAFDGLILPDLKHNRDLLSGDEPEIGRTAAKLKEILASRGLVDRNTDIVGIATDQFLPSDGGD